MILNIELSYLHLQASAYSWLGPFIDNAIRNQFGIGTQLFINPHPIAQDIVSDQTDDNQLQDFIADILLNSPIRQGARSRNEWYVNLLVASYHNDNILGNMYDAAIATNSRNGCAIFMSEIMELAKRDRVPLNEIVGRTVLHELGHCLALVHNTDLTIMSETSVLIQSPIPPGWFGNINYRYNPADIHFIQSRPDIAQPGGRIIEQTGTVSDAYLSARKNKGLKIELLNFDLDTQLAYQTGDIVSICVRLSNPRQRAIKLPFPLNQTSRDLVVTLSRPDGETVRLDLQKGCCSGLNAISLKPGATKYLSLNLFFDQNGYLFDTPGTYRIECFIRTFGQGGGWHSSGLTDLVIQPAVENRLAQLQKHKKRISGGYKPLYTSGFFKQLSAIQEQDPRLAIPFCWLATGACKNAIALSDDPKRTRKAIRQLTGLYEFLSIHEPFRIRRGKIQHDLQALNRSEAALSTPDIDTYQKLKDQLINRKPNLQKKQHYEKKLLAI